jgi:hypothetical protein
MRISELFEATPASGAGKHNGGKKKIAAKDEKKLADE